MQQCSLTFGLGSGNVGLVDCESERREILLSLIARCQLQVCRVCIGRVCRCVRPSKLLREVIESHVGEVWQSGRHVAHGGDGNMVL